MSASPEDQISPGSQLGSLFDKLTDTDLDNLTRESNTTPSSGPSPPESPVGKPADLDKRANARSLAVSLSLEEQVRLDISKSRIAIDLNRYLS